MTKYSFADARRLLKVSAGGLNSLIKRSELDIERTPMGKLNRYWFTSEDLEILASYRTTRGPKRNYALKEIGTPLKDKYGYMRCYAPWHPSSLRTGQVFEHVLVMEKKLKRLLGPDEVVHHINGIRHDNRIENLKIYNNQAQHLREGHILNGRVAMSTCKQRQVIEHILSMKDGEVQILMRHLKIKLK